MQRTRARRGAAPASTLHGAASVGRGLDRATPAAFSCLRYRPSGAVPSAVGPFGVASKTHLRVAFGWDRVGLGARAMLDAGAGRCPGALTAQVVAAAARVSA